jgi:hypothetical protein
MKRSRLKRKGISIKKVRLKSGSDVNVLREGFREGMMRSSNKHLVEYSRIPDGVVKGDVFLQLMKSEAKREIGRRNALIAKWGSEPAYFTASEKTEEIAKEVFTPLVKGIRFQEDFSGKLIDAFIKRTGIPVKREGITRVLEREAYKRGILHKHYP